MDNVATSDCWVVHCIGWDNGTIYMEIEVGVGAEVMQHGVAGLRVDVHRTYRFWRRISDYLGYGVLSSGFILEDTC